MVIGKMMMMMKTVLKCMKFNNLTCLKKNWFKKMQIARSPTRASEKKCPDDDESFFLHKYRTQPYKIKSTTMCEKNIKLLKVKE